MKKQVFTCEEIVGLKITAQGEWGGQILCFENDTFILFQANNGYGDSAELVTNEALDVRDWNAELLVKLGICTIKEICEINEAERIKSQARYDARDRQEFERLKAKFEGKN